MSPSASNTKTLAEVQKLNRKRLQGYREQALRIFPWVCAKCGREFSGKKVRQLTVHHKDHNHDNNPPDGSNWELLCIYCHDNEHSRLLESDWQSEQGIEQQNEAVTHRSLAGLAELLDAATKKK